MSSALDEPDVPMAATEDDDPMKGSGEEDEGEGDATMGNGASDDSSEEADEDEDEARKIREGFIVDEDEDEAEDEDDEAERRRRRKRRKRRHRREREEEDLEDEDLELLAENTGTSRLTRLRRGGGSESPPPERPRKHKQRAESSDDDIDDDLELPQVQDIQRIWDDVRDGGRDEEDEEDADMDDMDNFIEYEDEDEGAQMDESAREEARKEKRRRRREAILGSREMVGIDAGAWDEIFDVFGDGHEYEWALAGDDEVVNEEELKGEMKYQDVFEPTEIKDRHLTEDDDLIRAQDIPERMQLSHSTLSSTSTLSLHPPLSENNLDDAATWVLTRLSSQKERDFFRADGPYFDLLGDLVQAITYALRFLFVQEFEVPYVWTHKRDYISYFNPQETRPHVELLNLDELWRVFTLGQKYRSLLERRNALDTLYGRLDVNDEYFENEIRRRMDTVEVVADATEWLNLKFKDKKKDIQDSQIGEDGIDAPKHKLPSRISAYEVAKKSVVSQLADDFGITMQKVVLNFLAGEKVHFVDDHEINPIAHADAFVDPEATHANAEDVLARARMILATELGKDPLLRQEMRNLFKSDGLVSVLPTEKGLATITDTSPLFSFKYLHNKKVPDMLDSSQYLLILRAERELMITTTISLSPEAKSTFERRLIDAISSDGFRESVRSWNEERVKVVQEAIEQHLIPVGVKWIREWIKDEVEENVALQCADTLRERIDAVPYTAEDMQRGETPSVLAVSWGNGDPQRDDITMVFLDHEGRIRDQTRIDNLITQTSRDEFFDLLQRRKPEVIVVGGFSMATTKLHHGIDHLVNRIPINEMVGMPSDWQEPTDMREPMHIPVIYTYDDVARIFQHSKRADEEFGSLWPLAKYCVGLARYVQNPLAEFAALRSDLPTIMFREEYQHMIPTDRLLAAFERTLIDVVNAVGVDINRAVIDPYYRSLLPYVCGLGPRKAQALVQKISATGGSLINRDQFVKNGLLTTKIFLNAAGFLRITTEADSKLSKGRHHEDSDLADPLDNTRIHPEDYELARKMATDALELDEEDVQDEHPSYVVSMIMQDDDNVKKLEELNLDDFAVSMFEANQDRKRRTLDLIKKELIKPFGDRRPPFPTLTSWELLTMLTGQTQRTLRVGFIIPVTVVRYHNHFVHVRHDSGIEGIINAAYLNDDGIEPDKKSIVNGSALRGMIIDIKLDLPADLFRIELSARPNDLKGGDDQHRRVKHDEAWNYRQHDHDIQMQERKKRAEVGQARRVIKHPHFHNFTSSQAESFLNSQQRGDVVVRPSSKGVDHLAVTWKVDDDLYQHIDVMEPGADPTGQNMGTRFIVDREHEYADLDELIVNHVQAIARRVEDLMAHEKYKPTENDLHHHLRQFVKANPSKSTYGFTLNRRRPGHFHLCFLANANSAIQTWPVRVLPEAYRLFDTAAAGVPELCDAFKIRHLHESKNLGGAGGAAGKTPYGGRTPARTPGHATPGHMSVRQSGRTPNPYSAPTPAHAPTASAWGAPPPRPSGGAYGAPIPQTPYGFQTPAQGAPPSQVPPGMNPARAAMIQQGGGWGQGNGGQW